jgi:hypothetical protein
VSIKFGRFTSRFLLVLPTENAYVCVCVCVFVAQVYTTLACALFVSAVGVYMHMLLHIGGLITSLAFIATTMWLVSTPATPVNEVSFADGDCISFLFGLCVP